MAAALTVPQLSSSLNSSDDQVSLVPRHGVLTLFGYGISLRVELGHLIIEDGIGAPRRRARFARVGHGLRRVVIIGSDGSISLAAIRWLVDQDTALALIDREGRVLFSVGPTGIREARIRRAQARAHDSGVAMPIIHELIDRKLAGQERVASDLLHDMGAAASIAAERVAVRAAFTPDAVRNAEARAALSYWSAWHEVPVNFPRADLPRVPDHWRTFGARRSPLTGSPRLAVNPPNAILNYLYALAEAEARRAAVTLGLDPGCGILHMDADARDSLACDLMEVVRPMVDGYVLAWLRREPLRREWFFEQRDGNCRLMAPFAARLAETTPIWLRAVGPVAEWLAATLRSSLRPRRARAHQPTPLTQRLRREATGGAVRLDGPGPKLPRVCPDCGAELPRENDNRFCEACRPLASEVMTELAKRGRLTAHTPEAEAKRAAALQRNMEAQRTWAASGQAAMSRQAYDHQVRHRLASVTIATIATTLGVSIPYAADVRKGRRRPHPRHWSTLARLVEIELPER